MIFTDKLTIIGLSIGAALLPGLCLAGIEYLVVWLMFTIPEGASNVKTGIQVALVIFNWAGVALLINAIWAEAIQVAKTKANDRRAKNGG